uniref:Uncharacterized protein n=1 Tax=Ditylenchus dipsaci TaxID=166011 RepID=A0A915DR41_9BILA
MIDSFSEPVDEVLVKGFGIESRKHDFDKLKPDEWINDNIFHYYLNLIVHKDTFELQRESRYDVWAPSKHYEVCAMLNSECSQKVTFCKKFGLGYENDNSVYGSDCGWRQYMLPRNDPDCLIFFSSQDNQIEQDSKSGFGCVKFNPEIANFDCDTVIHSGRLKLTMNYTKIFIKPGGENCNVTLKMVSTKKVCEHKKKVSSMISVVQCPMRTKIVQRSLVTSTAVKDKKKEYDEIKQLLDEAKKRNQNFAHDDFGNLLFFASNDTAVSQLCSADLTRPSLLCFDIHMKKRCHISVPLNKLGCRETEYPLMNDGKSPKEELYLSYGAKKNCGGRKAVIKIAGQDLIRCTLGIACNTVSRELKLKYQREWHMRKRTNIRPLSQTAGSVPTPKIHQVWSTTNANATSFEEEESILKMANITMTRLVAEDQEKPQKEKAGNDSKSNGCSSSILLAGLILVW